ncbi:GntR family transcriptional regulator [Pararhizobium mangrovi]|uniref:GntR family transcriptional regulator n=1 Tax=Pararhizobium mangrovi TaxID=2590452 RepID=A0A506UBJ5_9HYPH|nr:GntR family transcriptional regulator [Pararhizobium mangrovi]TPW30215.1 GntR family transcriptional regulator [Pararhizobium mangrovi]
MDTENETLRGFSRIQRRKTTQDLVYEQIRDALTTGAFEAGRSFTITSMSEQFGTSHMPVREALRRLVAEHALELDSTGTARVPLTTREGLGNLCDARCVVERAAAEQACARFEPSQIEALSVIADTHAEALRKGDAVGMLATNRELHFTIYDAAGNPVLVNLIQNLWLRYGPYVRLLTNRMIELLKQDSAGNYSRFHGELLAALRERDADAAGAAVVADIKNSQRLLYRLFE